MTLRPSRPFCSVANSAIGLRSLVRVLFPICLTDKRGISFSGSIFGDIVVSFYVFRYLCVFSPQQLKYVHDFTWIRRRVFALRRDELEIESRKSSDGFGANNENNLTMLSCAVKIAVTTAFVNDWNGIVTSPCILLKFIFVFSRPKHKKCNAV